MSEARRRFIAQGDELLGDALAELLAAAGAPARMGVAREAACASALSQGRVSLDGRRLSVGAAGLRLAAGQRLELAEPAHNTHDAPEVLVSEAGVALVFKPSGLPSEGDRRSTDSLTQRLSLTLGSPVHAVSRLDAEVSGVMLVALTSEGNKRAAAWLAAGQVTRRYIGVVRGEPSPRAGTYRAPLASLPRGRSGVAPHGKPAVTHYATLEVTPLGGAAFGGARRTAHGAREPIHAAQRSSAASAPRGERFSAASAQAVQRPSAASAARGERSLDAHPHEPLVMPCAAWVSFTLETGRLHQIRAHTAAAGHPLLGDALYGGPTTLVQRRGARVAPGAAPRERSSHSG